MSPTRSIEDDVTELQLLLPALLRGLRQSGPGLGELEPHRRAFREAKLGNRHVRVLLALASAGPLSVGELATRIALTPATTSLLVSELGRAGFVERHEDDSDHRRTIISLPDHLSGPLRQFADASLEPLRRTLAQLEPGERAQLIHGLRLLTAETEAAAGQRAEPPGRQP